MNCTLNAYEQPAQRGLPLTRDELVLSHLPMVKFIVKRIASTLPSHQDRDDLRSAAVIGLISAAERFDPSRGVQFKTFAKNHIRGSVIDELRTQDPLTRFLREQSNRLECEFSRLEQRLGRGPSCDEVALAMGLELRDYFRLLSRIHLLTFVSLDDNWQEEDDAPDEEGSGSPQNQLIARQTVERVIEAIESLREKERIVIRLHYFEEMSLKEIADLLNLTESRISQLHSQGILRLRVRMKSLA